MVRLLAVLALAVSSLGCASCGPGCGPLWGCGSGSGCGDACGESGCGCEDPYACGGGGCDTGYCDAGCGCGDAGCCGECGCEPSCGCGADCGGGCGGGCCPHAVAGCPVCQDCRNCRLFRRGNAACGYDQCGGECGPSYTDYDYSACQQCDQGHGPGCCCCGCCETYSGCCCQPSGPRLLCLGRPSLQLRPRPAGRPDRVSVLHGPRPARFPDGQPAVDWARIDPASRVVLDPGLPTAPEFAYTTRIA